MDKDRFDAFMQLAEFEREVREGRRTFEWQVSLAVWAGVGAAAFAGSVSYGITIPVGLIVVVLHAYWVGWNYQRAELNAAWMYHYRDAARHILIPAIEPSEAPVVTLQRRADPEARWFQFGHHPPAAMQLAVTVFLVAAVAVLLANRVGAV